LCEGHTGRENTTLIRGAAEARVVVAAAGGMYAHRTGLDLGLTVADLGHETAGQGHETAGQGHKVAVQGHGTEVDLAAVTAAERVRPGTEVVGCRLVGNVHGLLGQGRGQLGQGRGQSLRRLQGLQGEL